MTTPGENDADLIRRITNEKDIYAFELFIKKHQNSLFKFIYKLCEDYELSEDITQESFIKFYKNISKMRHYTSVKSFLYTIAKNIFIDETRKRKIKEVPVEASENSYHVNTQTNQSFMLEEVLKNLNMDDRALSLLYFKFQLTHVELAEILGIPIGTVKSRLFNLFKKLRGVINDKL